MADKIDINALIAQAEAEGAAKTPKAKKDSVAKLPSGLHLDPSGDVINIFGIDRRVPSGFVTYVYDKNDNLVGSVSHGNYAPLKTETTKPDTNTAKKPKVDLAQINQSQAVSFKYAQTLQETATQEYDDLQMQAQLIARGSATPEQKTDFERAARNYKSTMDIIQASYEKSGVVQGAVNIDPKTGALAIGTSYVDPMKPQEGIKTVMPQGAVTSTQPTQELRYDQNGNSLVPGTAAYNAGTTTPPATIKTTGTLGGNTTGTGGAGVGGAASGAGSSGATTGTTSTKVAPPAQQFMPLAPGQTPVGANQPFSATPFESANPSQQQQFVQQFGGIAAMAFSTPWLAKILDQAITGNWDAKKFSNAVNLAPEFAAWGKSIQDGNLSFYGDPTHQAWAQQYNDKLQLLQQSALQQGIDPSVFGDKIDTSNPNAIQKAFADKNNGVNAYLSQYFNNAPSQAILDQFVANHAGLQKQDGGALSGTIATNAQALKSYAASMGVASQYLTPSWTDANGNKVASGTDYFSNAAQAIAQGHTTMDSEQALYRQQAQNIYKPFAQQIANGYSVAQLASPYTSAVQNLLELGSQPIDLGSTTGYGSMVTKALIGDGTNSMNLDQFTTQVKQRPEWLQTTNARNSLMDTASTLLRNFGLVVGG
jgi:hypothetical protein